MTIRYTKRAARDLRELPAKQKARVEAKLAQMEIDPRSADVVPLTNRPGFRLRVGPYRAVFERHGKVILVRHVLQRGRAYR